jgi:hypothetical protein
MKGRVRLCPYYFVSGEGDAARPQLGGVLATIVPADKKIVHGMADAILAPCSILPRDCKFAEPDWRALAPFWYPVAFSHEVTDKPFAAKLLDERLVDFSREWKSHRRARPVSASRRALEFRPGLKTAKSSAVTMVSVTTAKASAFAFRRIPARPFRRN